jgi:hypothetical protein
LTGGDLPVSHVDMFDSSRRILICAPGRYRGPMMFTTPVGYLRRFSEGFGVVSFGGRGGVAWGMCQFDTLLPNFGTVLRSATARWARLGVCEVLTP